MCQEKWKMKMNWKNRNSTHILGSFPDRNSALVQVYA